MPNDLVIKLLGEDATSPAIRSATAGIRGYGSAVRSTMSRISRDTADAAAAVKRYVSNDQAAAINRLRSLSELRSTDDWDVLWKELNHDEFQGLQQRQKGIDHAAAMYEKSVGRMAKALQKLNQEELESAAKSEMILSRRISAEEQMLSRSIGSRPDRGGGIGGVSGNRQMMIQQGVFLLDDAIAGGTNGGVRGALLGASNNATMLAMMLGGVGTQLAVIGGIAALQIGVRMYESFRKANDGAAMVRDRLKEINESVDRVGTSPVRLRYIDEEVEGQSSRRLARMEIDAQRTVTAMRASAAALEQELARSDALVRQIDTPYNKSMGVGIRFNSEEERRTARDQAVAQSREISERITQARNEERAAQEFIGYVRKNNSIELATQKEKADWQQQFRAETERVIREQEQSERKDQQRARKIERGNRELDRLNKERERFAIGLYGDQGKEEGILSQMQLRMSKARELFGDRPQQLAEAERQITSITEEQLARLKIGERSNQPLRSPSLALVDGDRARAITLGAGNQARDASTRIDKHNSAMEKLTADIRDGIKEMVAEAKKDIDLVIDVAEN